MSWATPSVDSSSVPNTVCGCEARTLSRLARAALPVRETMVALFHPFAEVAVHDIRRDRIVAIWKPISERRVGDRSWIDGLPEYTKYSRASGPHPKVLAAGRAITSVRVVLHNAKGADHGQSSTRHAAAHIARSMVVSRTTVHAWLQEAPT
jgi:predicted transcriptional regulator YheO